MRVMFKSILLIMLSLLSTHTRASETIHTENPEYSCADLKFSAREVLLEMEEFKRDTDRNIRSLSVDEAAVRYSLVLETINVHKIKDGGLTDSCSHLLNPSNLFLVECSDLHKGLNVCISKHSQDEERLTLAYFAQLREKIQTIRNEDKNTQ